MKTILPPIAILLSFFSLFSCNNGTTAPAATETNTVSPASTDAPQTTGNNQSTVRGQELFQQRCQACHGVGGNYRNNNAANLQISRIDSISIINTIKNGKGAMPMFSGAVPDSDLAQLELYVKTLRKP